MIWFWSFILNHGNVSSMLYDLCWSIDCYCFPVFSYEAKVYALFLVMSCYDIFDLTILSLRSIFLGCFPVTRRQLMWLLWIIFWCFPVTFIGMGEILWFFDLYFYEPRVGNLYVRLGSGLQWRPGPKVAARVTHCRLFNNWKHYTKWE